MHSNNLTHLLTSEKGLLDGELIRLRAMEPSDVELLYVVENDTTGWVNSDNIAPYSRDILMQYVVTMDPNPYNSGQLRLVIESIENPTPVGILDFFEISQLHRHSKLGIYILQQHRNKGYATDALRCGINYAAKMLGITHLLASVIYDNIASINLFRRLGFEKTGVLSSWHRQKDVHLYLKIL